MKRMVLAVLIASAMFPITVLADDITLVDDERKKVVLHDIETTVDYKGRPAIALDMTATVKQEPTTPMVIISYDLTVYQNGKSIDTAIEGTDSAFYDIAQNYVTKLKNGASTEFSVYYLLENELSDVEVEFSPHGFYSDDTVILYYSPSTDEITTDIPVEEPEPDYKVMYEELKAEYDELLEKYNELTGE